MEAGTYWLDPVDTETYISEETQQRLKRLSERFRHVYDDGCWNTGLRIRYLFSGKGYRIVEGSGLSYGERGKYEAVVGEKYAEKKSSPCGRYC